MIFNLDDNEQIADILIADGFDPGTIFTFINYHDISAYALLLWLVLEVRIFTITQQFRGWKSEKVEMEMVIEGSPNMFLHQTFENIIWMTSWLCNNYVIIYDVDFEAKRMSLRNANFSWFLFLTWINFCHLFTFVTIHKLCHRRWVTVTNSTLTIDESILI